MVRLTHLLVICLQADCLACSQGMEAKCYEMIESLQAGLTSNQAAGSAVSSEGLKPVLLRHIHSTQPTPFPGTLAANMYPLCLAYNQEQRPHLNHLLNRQSQSLLMCWAVT